MSRQQKPPRQISCIVDGGDDVFLVDIDPGLTIQRLKNTIYGTYFPTAGTAASDSLRLWKLQEPESIAPESTLRARLQQRGDHISQYAIWLDTHSLVEHYFPGDHDENLDVVVEIRCRPPPPPPPESSLTQPSQPSNIADARQTLVDDFNKLHHVGIELPIWTPKISCPKWIQEHIAKLRIPTAASGGPSLLFHNIGSAKVHGAGLQDRASKLFSDTGQIKYICNASGSGKTRLILEGLHNHWGFYFTARSLPDGVGSDDLGHIIRELGAVLKHLTLPSKAPEIAQHNARVASNAFYATLFSRVLIFHAFLLSAQQQPEGITERSKRAWLLLQLSPLAFFKTDKFFDQIASHRRHRSPEDFSALLVSELDSVRKLLGDEAIFLALDEAPELAQLYSAFFLSQTNPPAPRPVIRNLVETWSKHVSNMIISGTGLSMQTLEASLRSVIGKYNGKEAEPVTDLGAFESEANQRAYFKRYLPPRFLGSKSGRRLASRIVFWLHGRHRFTAAYIAALVHNCFESPHRVLDSIIHHMTKFRPSDADDIVEKEFAGVDEAFTSKLLAFNFAALHDDECMMSRVVACIFDYILTGKPRPIGGPVAESLVESGFARFRQTLDGVMDEPIVLLAAAEYFSTKTTWSMQNYLGTALLSPQATERGFAMERFGAFLLARAFESKGKSRTRLSSVFEFVGPTKLRRESAHLVSIGRDGANKYRSTSVNISPSSGNNYIWGQSPDSAEETLEWLKNPNDTALCFPDANVGPDLILLLQLSDATILRVLVQFKHNSKRTIGPVKTEAAFRTTDPLQFLTVKETSLDSDSPEPETSKPVAKRKRHRAVNRQVANPALNKKLRTALHDMAPLSNKAGKSSVLRVLVSYPAKPNVQTLQQLVSEDKSHHPGAFVDLLKLASDQEAKHIVLSLAARVTLTARQQQLAAGNQTLTKRKAESELSGSSSSKRPKRNAKAGLSGPSRPSGSKQPK